MFTQKNRLFLNEKKSLSFIMSIQYIFGAKIQYENEKAANASQHLRLPFSFSNVLCLHAIVFVRNS